MQSWQGYVESPNDALLLFEACRLHRLPRVHRRLTETERLQHVKSGAVFIWDEDESGIKRWTDGKHWSPSRINGSFLIYRQVEQRKRMEGEEEGKLEYVIKDGGLTKKAISITTNEGRRQHLVSYYTRRDAQERRLKTPSECADFGDLVISASVYPDFMPEGGAGVPAQTSLSSSSLSSSRSSLNSLPLTTSSATDRPHYVPITKHKRGSTSTSQSQSSGGKVGPHMGAYGHPINDKMVDRMPRPSLDSGKYLGYDGGHHHHHHPSQNSLGQQNAQHSPYESQHSSFDRPYDPTKSMYRDYDDGYSYDYPAVYQQHAFARQRSPSILTTMTVPLERNSEERRAMSVRSLPVGVLESTGAPHPSSSSSSSRHGNTPSNGMSRNGSAGSNGGNGSGGGSTNRLMLPPPTPMLRNPLLKGSQTAAAPPPPSPAAAAGPPATTAPGSSLASTAATGAGGGSYPTHAMGGMGVGDFKQPLFLAHANWTPDVGYRGRGSLEAVVGMGHDRIMTDVGRNSEMGRKSTGDADMSGEDDMDWEEN